MRTVNLPDFIYKNQLAFAEDKPEAVLITKLEVSEKGIFTWIQGAKYPMKGYPGAYRKLEGSSETFDFIVDRIEIVKRAMLLKAGSFASWRGLIALINWKRFLIEFIDFARRALYRFFLNPEMYCRSVREVYRIGMALVKDNDKPRGEGDYIHWEEQQPSRMLVEIICMIWEFDDAYRYRFQDAFGTAKSVKGGIKLLLERDKKGGQRKKWLMVKFLYRFLMIFPSVRKMIRRIDKEMDWWELELDVCDKYWALPKISYNFLGKNLEERLKIREQL